MLNVIFNGMFNSQICIYVFPDSEMLTIKWTLNKPELWIWFIRLILKIKIKKLICSWIVHHYFSQLVHIKIVSE